MCKTSTQGKERERGGGESKPERVKAERKTHAAMHRDARTAKETEAHRDWPSNESK